jgi:hypothetical protein
VAGTWKDLTDNVNLMAANLTGQVRNMLRSRPPSPTATCRRKSPSTCAARSGAEVHHQHDGGSTELLRGEVTRVAREVGTEGKLGGQAQVRGVGGVWKGLTDNVNMMAANLTGQVRNIAEVTTPSPTATCPKKSPSRSKARF